jgi:hypothetical protein
VPDRLCVFSVRFDPRAQAFRGQHRRDVLKRDPALRRNYAEWRRRDTTVRAYISVACQAHPSVLLRI